MLRTVRDLQRYTIHATDGDIGRVHEFYFDDQRWTVRHVVVTIGHLPPRHRVLIPVAPIARVDEERRKLHVTLTKAQVAASPTIDTEKPVSRQHEGKLYWYYGFAGAALPQELRGASGDPHLRRTREVLRYCVHGPDDRMGDVHDFLVDDGSWSIRYLVVDVRDWWHGKQALVPPSSIVYISWEGAAVHVDVSRATVRNAPEYDPRGPVDPDYETRLHDYYGRAKHQEGGAEQPGGLRSGTTGGRGEP